MWHGTIVDICVYIINRYVKFNYDQLQNEKVLGNWKSDSDDDK